MNKNMYETDFYGWTLLQSSLLKERNMEKKYLFSGNDKLEKWGQGEWVDEPDQVFAEYKNIKCKLLRHLFLGHFCGYVMLPVDHPWIKLNPFKLDCYVHGGITYGRDEGDGYWLGFDCAHAWDLIPANSKIMEDVKEEMKEKFPNFPSSYQESYKNLAFVIAECQNLADQVLEAQIVKEI
jgi:hypothetical protein